MPKVRRQSVAAGTAASNLHHSNATSSRFLGRTQRSWMQPGFQPSPFESANVGGVGESAASATAIDTSIAPQASIIAVHLPTGMETSHPEVENAQIALPSLGESLPNDLSSETIVDGMEQGTEQIPTQLERIDSTFYTHTSAGSVDSQECSRPIEQSPIAAADYASHEQLVPLHQNLPRLVTDVMGIAKPVSLQTMSTRTAPAAMNMPVEAQVPASSVVPPVSGEASFELYTDAPTISSRGTWDRNQANTRRTSVTAMNAMAIDSSNVQNLSEVITPNRTSTVFGRAFTSAQTSHAAHPIIHPSTAPSFWYISPTGTAYQTDPRFSATISTAAPRNNQLPSPPYSSNLTPSNMPHHAPIVSMTNETRRLVNSSPSAATTLQSPDNLGSWFFNTTMLLPDFSKNYMRLRQNTTYDAYVESRFSMNHLAIAHQDTFFLIFNQLYARWTIDPARTQAMLKVDISHFRHFEQYLLPNVPLPRTILDFFSNFPLTPESWQHDYMKQYWLPQINAMFHDFEYKLKKLWDYCYDTRLPPAARISSMFLQCQTSPALQRLLFERVFSQLFPKTKKVFRTAAFQLFDNNQRAFRFNAQQAMANNPQGYGEPEILRFRNEFLALCKTHNQSPNLTRTQPVGIVHPLPTPTTYYPSLQQGSYRGDQPGQPLEQVLHSVQPTPARSLSQSSLQHQRSASRNTVDSTSSSISSTLPQRSTNENAAVSALSGMSRELPSSQNRNVLLQLVATYKAGANSREKLFPAPDYTLPFTMDNDPNETAMHQAHLKSPSFRQATTTNPPPTTPLRIYTFFDSFLVQPKTISTATGYVVEEFVLSQELNLRRVKQVLPAKSDTFGGRRRIFEKDALMFRLRCIAIPDHENEEDEVEWTENATRWPDCGFFSINDKPIEVRKKTHHRKDLSADVSGLLVEGQNKLEISYHSIPVEMKLKFFVAIETTRTVEHATAASLTSVVERDLALKAITSKLQTAGNEDDEEMMMMDSHVSIDLIDPFTAQLCSKPVRGKNCLHRECFDLEAFLSSRVSTGKNGVISSESWNCPICKRDAKPTVLIVDGFLESVCKELIKDGKANVRAILVSPDGKWIPKLNPIKAVDAPLIQSQSMQDPRMSSNSKASTNNTDDQAEIAESTAVEQQNEMATVINSTIIDLDD